MDTGEFSDSLLGALLEAAVDAIIITDGRGRIVRVNGAASRLFGFETRDLVGTSVERLLPEGERSSHRGAMARYLRTEAARIVGTGRDVEALRADGSLAPVHLSVGHARIEGHDFFVAIMHDVSHRLAVEKALDQAHRMEALGVLTGGVAHDFNNILTVITGNLELLERSLKDERQHSLIRDALDAAELGADLTSKLLALGRKSPLAPHLIDPVEAVETTLSLLRRTLGPRIEVRLNVNGNVWPVRVDPAQLQTALINLALNAQDAMPEGGEITVAIANVPVDDTYLAGEMDIAQGPYVRISLTDTGTGMAPEVQRRAFEPFFTTKPSGKGTGLGLAMVYGFAGQSGGKATLYSEPGLGTTVSLYFPAVTVGETLRKPVSVQPADPGVSPGGRVLVVEDDETVRRLSVARIEALGYRTLAAASADEALALIGTDRDVDVLFADIVMPGTLNGHDLARRVRTDHPEIAVLLTSGFAGGAGAAAAEEFPILHKPYRQSDLATRLRILVSRRRG